MLRISALSSFGLLSVPAASGPFLCLLSLRGGGDEIAASSAWCRGSLQVGYAFGGEPNSFCSKAKINSETEVHPIVPCTKPDLSASWLLWGQWQGADATWLQWGLTEPCREGWGEGCSFGSS